MDRNMIDYFPEFEQDLREIIYLADREQAQMENYWNGTDSVWANQFISTLDTAGCSRWEKMLGIQNKDTYTLEERRSKIAGKLAEQRPFTMRWLEKTLTSLCGSGGYSLDLQPAAYTLSIKIALTSKNMLKDVSDLIDRAVPANLKVSTDLMYNQWSTFAGKTWADVAGITWQQAKDNPV